MIVEFLGTGGAFATPRPLCACRVCSEARKRGVPYSRGGPSVFVHGPDALVDTPEEVGSLLDRSGVRAVRACLYSHWHPDHVMGRRVFEALGWDLWSWPPENRPTDVYLPGRVARDFRKRLGGGEHLDYLEGIGVVNVHEVGEGEALTLNGVRVTPFPLAESFVYGFLFEEGDRRLLLVPDELRGWEPPEWVRGVDLAVLPKGLDEHDPLSGERRIPKGHPVLRSEATSEWTLGVVERLGAERTVLTHIEEPDGKTHDDLLRVAEKVREGRGLRVTYAYDTLTVEV
ncbi:Beta-lactamase superfamily domain [Rubrobacter radiotolerans]|uniref:Beta-lactamase superfamily domain n=1 Tax=Rubrobacter radiotolerans TaxID=42256 RepID=A0A023X3Y3_RUBRA|nr:MBL fold metallo-hydrolase [Rubrobacter radiotolerans]AHY46911.1 Beta-lactamase superfamily domain [Rubrobacter radiotolerans]MDX5894316.1 MBL fold metallo-hydrolase [Rubrobacter radiotolerans]SMC05720.1 phosphoribosyl 1,2-cyclic phosphate phosphodiesterase [Rubrobacter radiotolerans DSM 5868]